MSDEAKAEIERRIASQEREAQALLEELRWKQTILAVAKVDRKLARDMLEHL